MAADDLLKGGKAKGKGKGDGGAAAGGTTHGKSNGKGAGVGGFQNLGLSPPIFRGVFALGYKVPTPIQRKTLPIVLSGKDVVAMARTGSGKTAAFLIPMLEKLKAHSKKIGVRAVVLSPTRELAVQTLRFAKSLAKFTDLRISLIVGGEGMEAQFEMIASNPDVIVATPGRLMHHLQEIPDFNLKVVEYVVFDEADRLFEMGFAEQLEEILKTMPAARQTLLFSATLPKAIVSFARAGLNDPELVRLDVENKISENLKMTFFTVRSADKPALFLYMVRDFIAKDDQTIVFAATRHHVEFLHELLNANHIESSLVYGDMDQASRKISIGKFRAKKTNILIVTDVAARGIDIPLLNNVFNYSFPPTAKLFVHRVGRAARAGRSGTAFNFVDPDETPYMVDLHLYIGRRVEDSSPLKAEAYSLDTMKVTDIHYGAFPNELIDQETEHTNETLASHPAVQPLVKVCANAYKMYTRTRADPSKLSIKRAKELHVNKVHPFFLAEYVQAEAKIEKVQYIESLQSFRPQQTIFEVSTGAHSLKKTAPTVVMMQAKRKLHEKIVTKQKTKGKDEDDEYAHLAAGDDDELDGPGSFVKKAASAMGESADAAEDADGDEAMAEEAEQQPKKKTVFLSKFERKQLKKRVAAGAKEEDVMKEFAAAKEAKALASGGGDAGSDDEGAEYEKEEADEEGGANRFKDKENYITYMKEGEYMTEEFLSKGADGGTNAFQDSRMEEAIFDVNPDETKEMNKKRRVLHWDTRKKKFVKTAVSEITATGAVKRRNESGAVVKKKHQQGELYKKWQQRNHKRVFTGGEEGDDEGGAGKRLDYRNGKKPRLATGAPVANKYAKSELLDEGKIRKEEARKARSRGVKSIPGAKKYTKRGKGNIRGKTHGAPSRSKAIIRR